MSKLKSKVRKLKAKNMGLVTELERMKLLIKGDPLTFISQYGSELSSKMLSTIVSSLDYHRLMELLNWSAEDLQELYSIETDSQEKDNYLTKILGIAKSATFISEVVKIQADLSSK